MLKYIERSEFDHMPVVLSDEQIIDPYSVLEEFCSAFSLGQLRSTLTEMVEICLTIEDDLFRETKKRADALYISRKVTQVLEAVYVVIAQRQADLLSS